MKVIRDLGSTNNKGKWNEMLYSSEEGNFLVFSKCIQPTCKLEEYYFHIHGGLLKK